VIQPEEGYFVQYSRSPLFQHPQDWTDAILSNITYTDSFYKKNCYCPIVVLARIVRIVQAGLVLHDLADISLATPVLLEASIK
jgi:hypothetical protein